MAEQRLIDAEALIKKFEKLKKEANTLRDALYLDGVLAVIDTAPTVDAKPVVHAHWIYDKDTSLWGNPYICSKCHMANISESKFCPHCGAQMDEEAEE